MTDTSPKTPPATWPNEVGYEEALRALTHDMPREGNVLKPAIEGRMENGVRVITYSFDWQTPRFTHDHATDLKPMDKNHATRTLARQSMDQIEQVANIRFVEAKPGESPDIAYFNGNIAAGNGAYTMHREDLKGARDMVFSTTLNQAAITTTHELLHALGLSHPGGGTHGNDPRFNNDATIMSYILGYMPPGMGAFDVNALQAAYGKPKNRNIPDTLTEKDFSINTRFLFSDKPVTLDLSGLTQSGGSITIDMDKKIFGSLGSEGNIHTLLTHDTHIKDVLAGGQIQSALTVIGNALPNRIQGGSEADRLTAIGGGDIMSGGISDPKSSGKADIFLLTEKSGMHNIITDFSAEGANPDKLLVTTGSNVQLTEHAAFNFEGKSYRATEVTALDASGQPVTSAIMLGVGKDKLQLSQTTDNNLPATAVSVPTATPSVPQGKTDRSR